MQNKNEKENKIESNLHTSNIVVVRVEDSRLYLFLFH